VKVVQHQYFYNKQHGIVNKKMKEPKINPKLVIKTKPRMVREGGGFEFLIILIPLIIIILTIFL